MDSLRLLHVVRCSQFEICSFITCLFYPETLRYGRFRDPLDLEVDFEFLGPFMIQGPWKLGMVSCSGKVDIALWI